MAKRPLVEGGRLFQFRNGADGFFWKGMATKVDPGAQPLEHPRLVVNGRYRGGHIAARLPFTTDTGVAVPYNSPLGGTPTRWLPMSMFEHHSYAGVRLWFGSDMPVQENAEGASFGYIDTDWQPDYQEVAIAYNTVETTAPALGLSLVRFANFVYYGDWEAVRRIYRYDPDPAYYGSQYAKDAADEVVAFFDGMHVSALQVHEGILYMVVTDPSDSTTGAIYSWNGFEVVLEYALSVSGSDGVAIASHMNQLIVTVRGLGSIIYRKVDGTWATATTSGFESSAYLNSMAPLKDKLYIADGDTKIYSWNGATLALAHTISGSMTAPEELNVLCAWNGRLYYGWSEFVATVSYYHWRWPWIGVFDPDTVDASYIWKDDYIAPHESALTTNIASADGHEVGGNHPYTYYGIITAMAVYRGRLVLAIANKYGTTERLTDLYTHDVANCPDSTWYAFGGGSRGPLAVTPVSVTGNAGRWYKWFKVM